jgi:putative transposase
LLTKDYDKLMPGKNTVKIYVEDGYYHIYNRGVEKRKIYLDKIDYSVFLRFLKEYLLPPDHPDLLILKELSPRRNPVNCFGEIKLLSYCLMPNHFHLFVKQLDKEGLKKFMKALLTNYSMHFNQRYNRVGPLFQGIYKAALINNESYYLHITRYIHANSKELLTRDQPLHSYPYSSYKYYLNDNPPDWLNTKEILKMFRSARSLLPNDILSYESFVENFRPHNMEGFKELTLE